MIESGKLTTFKIGTGTQRDAVRIHATAVQAIEAPSEPVVTLKRKSHSTTPLNRWV
jgi:hypothetical protein